MRSHYDFSRGVRGKYAARYVAPANVVVLDPDVARVFTDQESVNETLRAVAHILDLQALKHRSAGATASRARGRARRATKGRRP